MNNPITVSTYNIHKGMSPLNRKVQIGDMAAALDSLKSDILFLQEVQGQNLPREAKLPGFPAKPQHDIIADYLDYHPSYGKNAVFPHKHHGNAIISRLPILSERNLNITVNRLEKRGVLHCEIRPEGWETPIVCLCAHLNLLERDRVKQYVAIFEYVTAYIPLDAPLILAGDFNDWRHKSPAQHRPHARPHRSVPRPARHAAQNFPRPPARAQPRPHLHPPPRNPRRPPAQAANPGSTSPTTSPSPPPYA